MTSSDWIPSKLGDLIEIRHGFAFDGECFRNDPPGDILLTPGNFAVGGGFKGGKFKYYAGPVPKDFVLVEGDLLVTMTDLSKGADTLGYPALVPFSKGFRFLHNQRLGKVLIRSGSPIRKDFLYHMLRSRPYRNEVLASATGTTVKHTSPERIRAFEFKLPSMDEQREIAHILGTLDDKIELNRRMNETLEAMASAIFKSWFVDFDPVRAKAEGRQPFGMEAETAALFPASFQDSPLGKIPKGWKVSEIREAANQVQYGLTRSASKEPVGPRFLRITDIQGGQVNWSLVPYCRVSVDEHEKYRIHAGDILVARTGASTGENVYVVQAPDSVFASYLVRIQFPESSIARVIGEFMRTASYFDYVAGALGGSAQPNASAQVLASAQFAFPPRAIAKRFAELIQPLDVRRTINDEQSATLTSIRDALLPRLISGEIRVPTSHPTEVATP